MGDRLKLLSFVYLPMCLGFFVAEPLGMPHVMVSIFWITMIVSGILYTKYPILNNSKWSVGHFWCHSVGLPLVIVSFTGYSLGNRGFIQFLLALGSFPILIFIFVITIRFIINWKTINARFVKPIRPKNKIISIGSTSMSPLKEAGRSII
jgi:hypothetical protein